MAEAILDTTSKTEPRHGARAGLGLVAVTAFAVPCALGAWSGFSQAGPTWFETLEFATLFIVTLALLLFGRGPARVARSAAGRILLAGCVVTAALALNPAFHALATANGTAEASGLSLLDRLPLIGCALLWFGALFFRTSTVAAPHAAAEPMSGAETFEALLKRPSVRLNLCIGALLALPAMALLSGMAIRTALWPAIFICALLLALRALLIFAGQPHCAWALILCLLAASGTLAALGVSSFMQLRADSAQTVASLEKGQLDEVQKSYAVTNQLSDKLRANGPRVEMESGLALQYEKQNNPAEALVHWEKVAALTQVDRSAFAPIRRVRCALGESLPPWRSLVFEGFPAIANPEIAPGVMRLAEVAGDVRSRLLGALLAWDMQKPDAERRKLLEAVQVAAPGEPSSMNLLKRLNAPVKDVPMWLPPDLIVGTIPTLSTERGSIEEIGEVFTVVCLNTGHWEMSLRASGTPLHEEWPVVRVEMNGLILATTQVNKAVEYDVPFTFDVTRNDIFKMRIVFQNREEDREEGHAARRGLNIAGIKFSHAK